MSQLTIRCLGGFEVRLGERPVTAFESNKVRALFVYLAMQRERSFSREHLATLLWPEKSDEAGRRNLRQAVYNLKSAISPELSGNPIILARGSELGIAPDIDCWLDVEAFVEARQQGITSESVVPHYLTGAVALYRGDFLAGFNLKDSPDFETWQLGQQTRLRDQVIDALRHLVESYLTRGEFRLGIQYARRLVAIDALSEEAHCYLMRLYAVSGARNRALLEYEQLRAALNRELDVEPLEETRKLYESILAEQAPQPAEEELGIGPLIPLVGRRTPYLQLRECWQSVLAGHCQLSIVEGETGIGKTRLVKSFLDAASAEHPTTIVEGQCSEHRPTAFQPFSEVLKNTAAENTRRAQRAFETSPELLANLTQLVPELRQLLPSQPLTTPRAGRASLFESFASFFDLMCRPGDEASTGEPLVLMLSRLQWASQETLELIEFLIERLADKPIWLLATRSSGESPSLLLELADRAPAASVQWIHLKRFGRSPVEEIASALLDEHQADELGDFLVRHGDGLPIAITEWINSLWDGRVLTHEAGRWRLHASLDDFSGDLDSLVKQRLQRLPSSIRRLAAQAAIMGEQFEARWLKVVANEHPQVVEVGLELLLERWLIRQHSNFWMTGRREHDIVLWAKGARLGSFEFNHRLIWQAILKDTCPERQQIMHQRTAMTLEEHFGEDTERYCETLAYHFVQAHNWQCAIGYLRRATRKALELSATDTTLHYGRQAIEVADRLCRAARTPDEVQRWTQQRTQIVAMLEGL